MNNSIIRRGFTLIELLVTIAIIGILTAIVVSNLVQAKASARDAKRITDLGNMQLAFNLYFDRCKRFPVAVITAQGIPIPSLSDNSCPAGNTIILGDYISTIPKDPDGTDYYYATNSNLNATDYILRATLETKNKVLEDDIDDSTYQECSDTSSAYYYCVGPE